MRILLFWKLKMLPFKSDDSGKKDLQFLKKLQVFENVGW